MYLSIDPGCNGGAVVVNFDLFVVDYCLFKNNKVGLLNLVDKYQITKVIIEDVRGYAGENVKSIFTFGKELGHIEGLLMSKTYTPDSFIRINPMSWTSFFKHCFTSKGKKKSCELVKSKYLELTKDIFREDSLSDAYLMLLYYDYNLKWKKRNEV